MTRAVAPLCAALVLAAALAGCAAPAAIEPPKMHYGADLCDHCGMIVTEERYAAAALAETEPRRTSPRRFDDIGCLLAWESESTEATIARFVQDRDGGGWIVAERAVYLHSPSLPTPMLSGLAAFSEASAAERFAATHPGRVVSWSEIRALVSEPAS